MSLNRPVPGTPAFGERLLGRLQGDSSIQGSVSLDGARASSRNTVIYRARAGDAPLVCKAELRTRRAFIKDEYRMLLELQRRLPGPGVRSLVPIAVYPDLGVLVTREEQGDTVRHYIDRGVRATEGSQARRFAQSLMAPCAEALFRFHEAFGLSRERRGVEHAQSYMDFHPANVLFTPAEEVVMMDPPPRQPLRPVHFDLGTFCFGIARAGFTPLALTRLSQQWLDALKADFVTAYFRCLDRCANAADLERIKTVERYRAQRALLRYRQFLRFRNWPREFARMAYFSPIIGAYLAFHLPKSYRRIAAHADQASTAGS